MKYKLISMDFDGTLLTSNKQVTEKSKKILLEYKIYHCRYNSEKFIKRK